LQFTDIKTLRVQENSCDDVLHYIGTVASLEVVTRRKLALLVVMSPFLQIAIIPQISKYNILLNKKLNYESITRKPFYDCYA